MHVRIIRGRWAWPTAAVLLGCAAALLPAAPPEAAQPPRAAFGTPGPARAAFGTPVTLPMPREAAPRLPEDMAWLRDGVMPVDLATVLRLSESTNLDIAQARSALAAARARLSGAQVTFLPSFNIGSTYLNHQGQIQRVEGNVVTVNRSSLFAYGGPSFSMSIADALFLPLVTRQTVDATDAGLRRVANTTFLSVGDAYFAVLRARRRLARVIVMLDYLTSERPSELRGKARGLLPTVRAFVEAGGAEALRAELERVRVEVLRREEERAAIVQELRVASAELARLVRLDPATPLWPLEDLRVTMTLAGDHLGERSVEDLLQIAAANRPELRENRALVMAAYERVRNARVRPWLPNLVLSYNWGEFGGGPDPNPPIPILSNGAIVGSRANTGFGAGGKLLHFNTRSDYEATMLWRFRNLGFGEVAVIREQEALHRQTKQRELQVQDRVVTEVVQARDFVRGWRERVDVTRSALFDKRGTPAGPVFQSIRLNFERIRNVPGTRPLEVLDAVRGLNDTLEAYGIAMTEYERSRFRLAVTLGVPHLGLPSPPNFPGPPAAADGPARTDPAPRP